MAPKKSLFLIDGHNLLYRTFFAIPRLSAPDGTPTNVALGFARVLIRILREEKPAAIAAVFDAPGPTPRHALYPEYKANRLKAPEDLVRQIPIVKEILDALGVRRVEQPGVEADDVIGTLSRMAEESGMDVRIVSSDKDLYQLVSERVRIQDGFRERTVGEEEVRETFGVSPQQVVDLLALSGDPSDNVPGVPGIGEKTAAELVREFGNLDALLSQSARLKGSRKEKIEKNAEAARLCRELVRIDRRVELALTPADLAPAGVDAGKIAPLFRRLGFKKLLDELAPESAPFLPPPQEPPATRHAFDRSDDPEGWLRQLGDRLPEKAAVVAGGTGEGAEAACAAEGARTVVFPARFAAAVARQLAGRGTTIFVVDGKTLLKGCAPVLSGEDAPLFDAQIAGYLLAPDEGTPTLPKLAERHLPGHAVPVSAHSPAERAAADAATLLTLGAALEEKLSDAGLSRIFRNVDMPLMPVLLRMEAKGIAIDPAIFRKLSQELAGRTREIEAKVSALAGAEFNINSPKQLQVLLFEKLGLPPVKRTKTGYSTDVDVLEQLRWLHEIPGLVLDYRGLEKIRSTYVDVLPGLVDPHDGRLHTTFSQTQAATGRLSSSNPNLQNIPIRTELGLEIRSGFVAAPGSLFVGADYSQVELRLLAHLSGCEELVRTFRQGEDIHAATAARVFGVSPKEVTPDHRRKAKVINFGILYGMSAFGLSRELGIGGREAREYIEQYFRRYPGVREYIEAVKKKAREDGFTQTILGRRRYVRDIDSRNKVLRDAAERIAINAPIQGSAADIIKIAMIRVDREFFSHGMEARLILQVHDELIVEAPRGEAQRAAGILRGAMEKAAELVVPLTVSVATGENWGEIH